MVLNQFPSEYGALVEMVDRSFDSQDLAESHLGSVRRVMVELRANDGVSSRNAACTRDIVN